MDIDDIIDMQSEQAAESTLESEIDALSKIITDGAQKLDDSDEDFKLDSDDITFTANLQYDSVEPDKCELLTDDSLGIKDILNDAGELENFMSNANNEDVSESLETSESATNIQENKEYESSSQEQTENSEVFISEADTINQNEGMVLGTEPFIVNNSLSLISEAYNSQESQSCSESQPASVAEIEEVTESASGVELEESENQENASTLEMIASKIESPAVDLPSEINNIIEECTEQNLTEPNNAIDALKEKLEVDFAEGSTKQNLTEADNVIEPLKEKLDVDIGEGSIEQNLTEQNEVTDPLEEKLDGDTVEESIQQDAAEKNNDNINEDQTDFVQTMNLLEKEHDNECISFECIHNKDMNLDINEQIEEHSQEKIAIEGDSFIDKENSSGQQEISSCERTDLVEENSNSATEKVDAKFEKTESVNNIEQLKQESDNVNKDLECQNEDAAEAINQTAIIPIESNISTPEIKDPLESVSNLIEDYCQNFEDSEILEGKDNLVEPIVENITEAEKINDEKTTIHEIESVATTHLESCTSHMEEETKSYKTEAMDIDEVLGTNDQPVENPEANLLAISQMEETKPIYEQSESSENLKQKATEILSNINTDISTETDEAASNKNIQDVQLDINVQTLQDENVTSENVKEIIESSLEVAKTDFMQQSENINVIEQFPQHNETLDNSEMLPKVETLQKTESIDKMDSSETIKCLENVDINPDNETLQDSDNSKLSADIENLEKVDSQNVDTEKLQETEAVKNIDALHDSENLENINADILTLEESENVSKDLSEDVKSSVEIQSTDITKSTENIEILDHVNDVETSQDKEISSKIQSSTIVENVENVEILDNANDNMGTSQETETCRNIQSSDQIESLENETISLKPESLEEETVKSSQNTDVIENIEIEKETITNEHIETLKDTSKVIEAEKITESPNQDVRNDHENIDIVKEITDYETTTSIIEFDIANQQENSKDKEMLSELSLTIKNDEEENKIYIEAETNRVVMDIDLDLITDPQSQNVNDLIKETTESDIKGVLESNFTNDQHTIALSSTTTDDGISIKEDLAAQLNLTNVCETSIRVETPEDLNITLELDEPEALDKANLIENVEMKEVTENPKVEEPLKEDAITEEIKGNVVESIHDPIEENVEKQLIYQETIQDTNDEEVEDQVEINLSLDPEGYSSPMAQDLPEMSETSIDDPLEEFQLDNENLNAAELQESSKIVEPDFSEILGVSEKVDVIISGDQCSDSQEFRSNILKGVGDLESDLDKFLDAEDTINKQVSDLDNLETANLVEQELQSQNSLLDALESEAIPGEKENEGIKGSDPTEKEEDITLMLEESSQSPRQMQDDKFVNVLENIMKVDFEMEKTSKNIEDPESSSKIEDSAELIGAGGLETDSKLLFQNAENEGDMNETSAEISELESAVKFLQESEEQDTETFKIVDDVNANDENSSIFVSVENVCDNATELVSDLPDVTLDPIAISEADVTLDPIAISEAEIISEAAKLESERKEKINLEQQLLSLVPESSDLNSIETSALPAADKLLTDEEPQEQLSDEPEITDTDTSKPQSPSEAQQTSESSSETSVQDDVCKAIPAVEVPEVSPKVADLPGTPKSSLLIQKDAKQRLESPDRLVTSEPKIAETPKKESGEKQQREPQYLECENVGSPRIILKIAKSAIAECSEPRSPKSPKIRSAANSPNPEDSPGHKLGKIKLKLSKGGHPSIIPSIDNYDDAAQWHTDSTSTLSPLGMKIKLTKSADASIVESKHEEAQKQEETKEKSAPKTEEGRKGEASIGMKIKLSKTGDASIVQQDSKDSPQESTTKKQDSPSIGMKIKLSKTGDASIIQQDTKPQSGEDVKETVPKAKDKTIEDVQEGTRRTESPLGMKIKLSKSGDASVISNDPPELAKDVMEAKERNEDPCKRMDSPLGMKIKLSKTKDGNASIISNESTEEMKEKIDTIEGSKKVKQTRKRDATEECSESDKQSDISKAKIAKVMGSESEAASTTDVADEISKTGFGMKIKLSKSGDASVVHTREASPGETTRKVTEQPIGMKIKLSKTGDPSIIHSETVKEAEDTTHSTKTKHSKNKDHGNTVQQKSKDDSSLEMKIKLSKTGHPTIITTNELQDDPLKISNITAGQSLKLKDHKDLLTFKESTLKAIKKSHSDVTIEPIKSQTIDTAMIDFQNKRKEITIAPIEVKKLKMDANIKQMLPDVTIQPIIPAAKKEHHHHQQKLVMNSVSQHQMNVINQEISITQICSLTTGDTLTGDRLKNALNVQNEPSPLNSDCEIIEPQPELIIVNENSNSSQDVMIIDEVPPTKSMTKVPKKRGRPRRNATATAVSATPIHNFQDLELQRDPLSLDQPPLPTMQQQLDMQMQMHHQQHMQPVQQIQPPVPGSAEASERPRRTCRSQKSYAPPKRGRGRGRGKRKNEAVDIPMKKSRIDQDLTAIENSTTAMITLEKIPIESTNLNNSPELFKALNQPTLERTQFRKMEIRELAKTAQALPESPKVDVQLQQIEIQQEEHTAVQDTVQDTISEEIVEMTEITIGTTDDADALPSTSTEAENLMEVDKVASSEDIEEEAMEKADTIVIKITEEDEKQPDSVGEGVGEQTIILAENSKDPLTIHEHQNWLAPSIKKVSTEPAARTEPISTLTVIDEETRMSAESSSRSQTPARNIVSVPGTSEPLVNEESQGSVLSTATTESEKVKVKIRRLEISLDPDEGPFTVEKIAEYEWPLEKKEDRPAVRGETFMIQEQISQYLGVKSFKRKYPDLKRRMVDMEERNFLREHGLVSESMCDMGLTAVSSSEVLDIMCSDFPEQYEEYRKHMREKAAKEHSKKQKELSAAANAERNRIDLAEMAMQSAISWNAEFNRARQDSRKCSLDLQTFTVHMPKRPPKVDPNKRGNSYPVAVLPGQYSDYYREYTPAELRYYPLNTVLYGPMRPNERKFDSQSEGSQSDSDSDSSSDDSSSSSSEGTQDTEGSQSTMDEVDMELALQTDIKCKMCLDNVNTQLRPEVFIQCGTCSGNVHPSCIDLTLDMVPHIKAYAWQCTDCKTCAQCHDPADEDKMLFCDMCDRGYHIYCVGLRRVPQGRWHCQECAVCANCGSKEPGGANFDRNSVAQWQHEYKKGDKNTRVYVSTFCVPCSKLWRKGRYCPHCSRCHNAPRLDLEPNLVHCGACDKYLHLGCVETKGLIIDKKHYFCEFCSPNRQQLVKPLMSKTFKT